MAPRILLVDDELSVLNSLKRVLRTEGYEIDVAASGREALEIVSVKDVAVILCDHNMAGMTGPEVLAESAKLRPDAVRITLTASAELRTAQASINTGRVSHFLTKPWDDAHLRAVVREAVHRFQIEREVRRLHELTEQQRDELQRWNEELEQQVQERTQQVRAAYEETLDALVLALDSREQATGGHSRRVAVYCLYLTLEVGVPHDQIEDLYRGAVLHDIGKIGVPDAVLLKPGKLNSQERAQMEQHVVIGGELLERVSYLKAALPIPRYHHERYDGTGYCKGLAGEGIPIQARIFAVVDVYDALRSRRPYKEPMSHEQACEIIAAESGRHFDPSIARAFLGVSAHTWGLLGTAAKTANRYTDALAARESIKVGTPREDGMEVRELIVAKTE